MPHHAASQFYRTTRRRTEASTPQKTEDESLGQKRTQITANHQAKSSKNQKKPLIVIVGPTASGKTNLAIYLAKKLNGELISADSRQIYKGLDVGTAKDRTFPHHLVDIVPVSESFSVNQFVDRALPTIAMIHQKGKIPILVGGTGYYVDAVLYENRIPAIPPDEQLRSQLEHRTTAELFRLLSQKDSRSAQRVDQTNRKRIIRALEIVLTSGRPVPSRTRPIPRFNHLLIAIELDRQTLYQRIDQRVDWMLLNGLINETKWLLTQVPAGHELVKTIGYQEVAQYLRGEIIQHELPDRIKFHTHALARKQISWWKRYQDVHWVKNKKNALGISSRLVGFDKLNLDATDEVAVPV